MLSPASLSIVRQTLPAVGAAIPEITTLFYGKLFADHPTLLSDLFNRGNQATGAQQQALAGSIARFATLVVNNPGQDPGPLLARVARKHASLGVTADQYEIVHTYLFAQCRSSSRSGSSPGPRHARNCDPARALRS